MQVQVKSWGNSQGIRLPKALLESAGIGMNDTLQAEIKGNEIILRKSFRHRTLKERAAAYGGALRLTEEMERDEPMGREVW